MLFRSTMPVAPTSANGGFGGFGGDGWWIILFFIVLFGWGGNGWGGNNGGVMDGYVLTSDFANIERKLDSVNNGLCDGFYAMNTGMLNGFAGVTQAVTNGFYSSELSRCNQQAALMQQLNAMQMQAQECCCENRAAIAQVRYDMATQACDTRNTVQNATRDIIDKLVHSIKNIDKICMSDGYSRRSEWDAEGFMRGNSYKRDSMGRYSRDDGYSRRNYSRADESEHAIEQLEEMLKTAGCESEHMAIKKAISILKNA